MKHECEHMDADTMGACRNCLEPMRPKPSRFVGTKLPWGLEFKGHHLKDYATLNKALVETAQENWEDYMLISPNGLRLSIEVGRMI